MFLLRVNVKKIYWSLLLLAVKYRVFHEQQANNNELLQKQHKTKITYHECLNEYTDDALKTHYEYGFRAFLGSRPGSIADRVLCLHGEEEAASEGVDVAETGNEVLALFRGI